MENKLIDAIIECLELEDGELNLNTKFKELPEWDSLGLLSFMAMLEDEFDTQVSRQQLDQFVTIADILEFIKC